ncbi:MAG TPA: hypothetical protein VGG84_16455 [Gemmatimonadaceae bacterium]
MTRLVRRRLVLVAILAAAIACAGHEVAAPRLLSSAGGAALRDQTGADHVASGREPNPVRCARRKSASGSGVFGPSGGTLFFGNSRLVIPGGALRTPVTITAVTPGDGTSTVHFEPEGLHFFKPAGLSLDSDGCALPSIGTLAIVYFDSEGNVLETIPAFREPRTKTVVAPIIHFSNYAIAF